MTRTRGPISARTESLPTQAKDNAPLPPKKFPSPKPSPDHHAAPHPTAAARRRAVAAVVRCATRPATTSRIRRSRCFPVGRFAHDMGTHLCALPTCEYYPKSLVCLGCTDAQPKQSDAPVFRRMLASHERALATAQQRGEPEGQIAARQLEVSRISHAPSGGSAVRCRCRDRRGGGQLAPCHRRPCSVSTIAPPSLTSRTHSLSLDFNSRIPMRRSAMTSPQPNETTFSSYETTSAHLSGISIAAVGSGARVWVRSRRRRRVRLGRTRHTCHAPGRATQRTAHRAAEDDGPLPSVLVSQSLSHHRPVPDGDARRGLSDLAHDGSLRS
jgi:hypothetical protein